MKSRAAIIRALQKYFTIQELVCPHIYQRWREEAWRFLDYRYLWCLLVIREEIIKAPMLCNGGSYTQRGMRCNLCGLVSEKSRPYLSAHVLGKAGDFSSSSLSAEQMRQKIEAHADLLPFPIRIEKGVSWLHFDVMEMDTDLKVYEFSE